MQKYHFDPSTTRAAAAAGWDRQRLQTRNSSSPSSHAETSTKEQRSFHSDTKETRNEGEIFHQELQIFKPQISPPELLARRAHRQMEDRHHVDYGSNKEAT